MWANIVILSFENCSLQEQDENDVQCWMDIGDMADLHDVGLAMTR